MNKNLFFLFFSILIWGGACSNDFDVAAPWKDIPIVYGLINIDEDVHYIRVEKAFLDPDADATILAQNADSLYYKNVSVMLEVGDNTFDLERVDGTQLPDPILREDGVFATTPNYLYKIDKATLGLEADDVVNLVIDRENGLPLVTASTITQSKGVLKTPNPESSNGPKLDFTSIQPEEIKWQSHETASVFDVELFFNYVEYPAGQPDEFEVKSLPWIWVKGTRASELEDGSSYSAEVEASQFYEFLANNIEADPDKVRIFQDILIRITAGGESLEKYVTVVQANTGITGSQEPPTFTNLSEGQGVFSSVDILEVGGILLSNPTNDELRNNPLTAPLNFQ